MDFSLDMKEMLRVFTGLTQYQGAELGEGVADYQIDSLSELLVLL